MIEFYHVGKRYRGQERPALQDITFQILSGEWCLITGPSGSGKTSLLRILFCMERPNFGHVLFFGQNISSVSANQIPAIRRQMGFVFERPFLIPAFNVWQNVALPLRLFGFSYQESKERAIAMLEQVGLLGKIHATCDQLSLGEGQRVCIARAMVGQPRVLLCDEPTAGLDERKSREVIELLERFYQQQTTVVVATHHPALFQRHASRLYHLRDGQLQR